MSNPLVAKVKEMQKTDPKAKAQWEAFTTVEGGGMRDPAKHDAEFLKTFISNYDSGMVFKVENDEGDEGKQKLVDLLKMGQRKSKAWKDCWRTYCKVNHDGSCDPTGHTYEFLRGFFDFLGREGVMSMNMGGPMMMNPMMGMGGMGMNPMMMGMMDGGKGGKGMIKGMKGGGGKGSSPYGSGFDRKKDKLIERIKAFQRSGQSEKEQWWDYADTHLENKRDPAKHDADVLEDFCSQYGVP